MTTNQLMTRNPSLSGLGLGFGNLGLFPDSIFDRIMNLPFNQPNLMRHHVKEDGTKVVEYNLAGYSEEEISVNIDTALHELIIKAEHNEDGNSRKFTTTLSLSPYTSPEDVNVAYKNGVLSMEIAPLEKRREESLIPLSLNKGDEKASQNTIQQEEKTG